MALFEVSTADYEVRSGGFADCIRANVQQILASILKDGVGMRRPFTFKELRDVGDDSGFL